MCSLGYIFTSGADSQSVCNVLYFMLPYSTQIQNKVLRSFRLQLSEIACAKEREYTSNQINPKREPFSNVTKKQIQRLRDRGNFDGLEQGANITKSSTTN
jgi:hypothetical protein